MDRLTLRWFARDLDMRGNLVANALSETVSDALQNSRGRRLESLFDRALQDERLVAMGWCSEADLVGHQTAQSPPTSRATARANSPAAATPPCSSKAAPCTSACTRSPPRPARWAASCCCTT